jgi:hypothetical protein
MFFKDILSSITSNLIPASILVLLFLLALGAFVKRTEIPLLAGGLARLVIIVVGSPLLFLRKLIGEIIDQERVEEHQSLASDQFLIRRQLSGLKAGLIVASILVLGLGFAGAYGSLPSREDFKNRREARQHLAEMPQRPAALVARIKELETSWLANRPSNLDHWLRQNEQRLLDLRASRLALEPQLPPDLKILLPESLSAMPYKSYGERESTAYQVYRNNDSHQGNALSNQYFQLLYSERRIASNLEQIDKLRSAQQPDWPVTLGAVKTYPDDLDQARQRVVSSEGLIRSKRWLAIFAFATTIGFFYLVAWFVGILIEFYGLVIGVAGDLRVLRDREAAGPQEAGVAEPTMSLFSSFRTQ